MSDPDAPNDTSSTDVTVERDADLSITKTATSEGVLLGGTAEYTLTMTNNGPSDTTGAKVTDAIPAGLTVAALPSGCAESAGVITCSVPGTFAAGDVASFVVTLDVPDTLDPATFTNTVTASSDIVDPGRSNDSASATIEAVAQADVTLTKELITPNPIAGQPVEFRLTLTNNGPTVAPNASLSDPIPAGTTFVSLTATQGACRLDEVEDVPSASCSLGRLAVGATATATLTVTTDPSATSLSNTGFAGSGGLDDAPADNEAAATGVLRAVSDLSITKTGPATVSSAAAVEYTLAYRNDGPSPARGVVVSDTLPAGLTPRPPTGCSAAAQVVSCPVGDLAVGATGSVLIGAEVTSGLAVGTVLSDTAGITSASSDPDPSDDTATLTSTVEVHNDIGVTVTAQEKQVRAGDAASYKVVVVNNGPQLASGVTLVNTLPAEIGAVDASFGQAVAPPMLLPQGCLPTGATITCALGDLAVGATKTVVFGGTVRARDSCRDPPGRLGDRELQRHRRRRGQQLQQRRDRRRRRHLSRRRGWWHASSDRRGNRSAPSGRRRGAVRRDRAAHRRGGPSPATPASLALTSCPSATRSGTDWARQSPSSTVPGSRTAAAGST